MGKRDGRGSREDKACRGCTIAAIPTSPQRAQPCPVPPHLQQLDALREGEAQRLEGGDVEGVLRRDDRQLLGCGGWGVKGEEA